MDEQQRRERLRAMGVVLWRARGVAAAPAPATQAVGNSCSTAARPVVKQSASAPVYEPDMPSAAHAAGDPLLDADTVLPAVDNDDVAPGLAVDLEALRVQVSECTRCDLHQSRTQTVFGAGNASARLLVIGEAPGADEDAQGEPFVGRAGKLLNAMLMGIGLRREQVYIANILKCRPPGNRDPHAEEVASCGHYLQQQIAFVAPELILAVGRIAAQNLLGVSTPIGKMRGHTHTHTSSGTPVIVTYHPAYLLRSPVEKRRAWQDLKQVAARLRLEL